MTPPLAVNVVDLPALRERVGVFCDRTHGGQVLADLLSDLSAPETLVLALPAGGMPVAAALARALGLPLDVAVVSKITLPWNTESGYGAVAFDGTVFLNDPLLPRLGLSRAEVEAGIASTREKVRRREGIFRAGRPPLCVAARPVLLVDDGLASGITMRAAMAAVERACASDVQVAIPTGHADLVGQVAAPGAAGVLRQRTQWRSLRGG